MPSLRRCPVFVPLVGSTTPRGTCSAPGPSEPGCSPKRNARACCFPSGLRTPGWRSGAPLTSTCPALRAALPHLTWPSLAPSAGAGQRGCGLCAGEDVAPGHGGPLRGSGHQVRAARRRDHRGLGQSGGAGAPPGCCGGCGSRGRGPGGHVRRMVQELSVTIRAHRARAALRRRAELHSQKCSGQARSAAVLLEAAAE